MVPGASAAADLTHIERVTLKCMTLWRRLTAPSLTIMGLKGGGVARVHGLSCDYGKNMQNMTQWRGKFNSMKPRLILMIKKKTNNVLILEKWGCCNFCMECFKRSSAYWWRMASQILVIDQVMFPNCCQSPTRTNEYIDGLSEGCSNSIALARELLQSSAKPSISSMGLE